ncbi:hypothetical protein COU78_06580 [Candidatus Peregrinibacteria bacterium CG10_big_fil_rev_8_21_14_0_10_49_24]|nr:MAG: hypothetical protein COU78_06580 [Candidatus Peregrinibacteria bacterium CG10_big_fil_rev_8_21_14_0_10_49_24]PJA67803.1 MAG: hypothetical protein CO157_02185 [Candidatus Peregrinibacteria bacterium CG_4_9_14_3_um_filter_49_12]
MDANMQSCHKKPMAAVLVAVLLGGSYIAGQYVRTQDHSKPTISIQGEGKVTAVPDIAELNFGVQTGRRKTAQDAMELLGNKMNAISQAVLAAGVEEKDITTQNLWMNPAYDYFDGKRVESGFEASQNLVVKVRDISKLTSILDAAVTKGANQVGGVNFTIDDPEELRAEARAMAIADAQEKAVKLAADLGKTLGKFKGYNEGGYSSPMPYARMDTMMMESGGMGGGGAPPIPAGEQEIRANIILMYELR